METRTQPCRPLSPHRVRRGRVLLCSPQISPHLVLTGKIEFLLPSCPHGRHVMLGDSLSVESQPRKDFAFVFSGSCLSLILAADSHLPASLLFLFGASSPMPFPLTGEENLKLLQSVGPEFESPLFHLAGWSWASYKISVPLILCGAHNLMFLTGLI